ncbi:hypothetical protein MSPP1_002145 [Malassezia sp. CBS 17886]|nr:hypothetical protein MSPP1_002145 [Malassezia sp. CBS 17886]
MASHADLHEGSAGALQQTKEETADNKVPAPEDDSAAGTDSPRTVQPRYRLSEEAHALLCEPAVFVTRGHSWWTTIAEFDARKEFAIQALDGRPIGQVSEERGHRLRRVFWETMRPFQAYIFGASQQPLFKIDRGLNVLNSHALIYMYDYSAQVPMERLIGQIKLRWNPVFRYLSLYDMVGTGAGPAPLEPFLKIRSRPLSWQFLMTDSMGRVAAGVQRIFRTWSRELFTDTGSYLVRFSPVADDMTLRVRNASRKNAPMVTRSVRDMGLPPIDGTTPALSPTQRAVVLAASVLIDCRHKVKLNC